MSINEAGKKEKHIKLKLFIAAIVIAGGAFTIHLVKNNNDDKEYKYYTDIVDENADNTFIDELFLEGETINLDGEDISLKTAVDKMDASNKIYEVLKEYLKDNDDAKTIEMTEEEKNEYIDDYINSDIQDIDYINNLIDEYKETEDGFEQAKIVRKLVCIEDYLSEYTDKYGTQILNRLSDLMLETASMQAYGSEDPDSYKNYQFTYEYKDELCDKVVTTIKDETTGHEEEITFNDIFGGAGAYVDLYNAQKNMNYSSEHDRSTDLMRESYASVLDSAKDALKVNPETANQQIHEIIPIFKRR